LFEDLQQQNEEVFLIWIFDYVTSALFFAAMLAMTLFSFIWRNIAAEMINN